MEGERDLVPPSAEPGRSTPAPRGRTARRQMGRARHRPLPDAEHANRTDRPLDGVTGHSSRGMPFSSANRSGVLRYRRSISTNGFSAAVGPLVSGVRVISNRRTSPGGNAPRPRQPSARRIDALAWRVSCSRRGMIRLPERRAPIEKSGRWPPSSSRKPSCLGEMTGSTIPWRQLSGWNGRRS